MTTPMEEAEFSEYVRVLLELEQEGTSTTAKIGPWSAFMLIGLVQLALRHPDVAGSAGLTRVGHGFIDQCTVLFANTPGEEIIRRGFLPQYDVPIDRLRK